MTREDYLFKVDRANKLSFEYYVLSQPSVSDELFDGLVADIEQIEQEHPEWVVADSPTQKVGSDLNGNGRRTIRHRTPMLSCQKAQTDNKSTNREKLEKWLTATEKAIGHRNFNYCVEWKYDGISCSLVYLNGELISAATRGDHFKGQDITAHVRCIEDVPQQLQKGTTYHGRVEVRGEVIMRAASLPLTADQNGKPYTDCRSAASSLCNQAVADRSQCSLLEFMPWEFDAPLFSMNNSHYETLSLAEWHGFARNSGRSVSIPATDHEQLFDLISRMEQNREGLGFPVDGIVIKVDDKKLSESLGATEHHPKGNIAYKFAAAKTVSRVTRIEVTVGKTGKRTPVVHFEPVTILGRTCRKASVGSEATLQKLGVKMGCMVEVGLANDVRPTVYRVIADVENQTVEVTENDPLEGIDFPDEQPEVAPEATTKEQPEELYHPRSLFDGLDEEEEGGEETAEVPADSEEPTEEPTHTGDSPSQESEANSQLSTLNSQLGNVLSVIGICIITVFGLALACFGIPLLAGSLKA